MSVDALVTMANGERKRIADIVPGDQVLSLGDDLRLRTNTVTASFSTGIQPAYRLTTNSGRSVVVTAEHPLYSAAGWLPAGEFKVDDWIGVPRGYGDIGSGEADAKEMRLLGYLLGDGGLTHTSPMFTNEDPEILTDIERCLPAGHKLIYVANYDYRIGLGNGQGRNHDDKGRFSGGHNLVTERCKQWGIWGKLAKDKRIPAFVFGLNNRAVANVLRALFDCDGTVDSKGIEICLASEGMIDDIQHLLLRFGIVGRKRHKPVKLGDKVFDSWRLNFAELRALETWQREIGFEGPKCARLAALVEQKRGQRPNGKDLIPNFPIAACWEKLGKRAWQQPHSDQVGYELLRSTRQENVSRHFAGLLAEHFGIGGAIAYSDIVWDKVTSIEPLGELPVWDITVADGHNFIADDVFCHNTSWGPWWLWREIYGFDGYPGRGSGDYIAATATFDLFKLKLLPELRYIFERVLGVGRYWSGDKIIELRNPETEEFEAATSSDPMWGRIILRSASSEGGLESATAKGAWLDEAGQDSFRIDAWEAVLRRLSIHEGRVLGTTTPYNLGWIKTQIYDQWLKGDKDFDVIQFASTMNPNFSKREFKRAERTMPLWKFLMFYKGEFARPPGLIYSDFNEEYNKCKPFTIPPHWPRFVGLDPGGVNLATIWVAEDPVTHMYYIYRETLEGNMTTKEHVEALRKRAEGENLVMVAGGAPSEGQIRLDWGANGQLVHEPLITEVWPGIDRVIELFKEKRLVVFDTCTGLLDELRIYSRKLDPKTLEPINEIKDKNRYHRLDSLRYVASRLQTATWDDVDPLSGKADNPWAIGQQKGERVPGGKGAYSWWKH